MEADLSLQIIWLLYPETKGRALEDMDSLFGKGEDRNATVPLGGVIDGAGQDADVPSARSSNEEDEPLLS